MPPQALLGLAVSSDNAGASSTATFDSVSLGACPDGWSCDDIGSPAIAGGQTSFPGIYTVQSAGADIGTAASNGTADDIRYQWQQASGDSSIAARVVPQATADPCAKFGLMYRTGTDAGAPEYSIVITTGCGNFGQRAILVQYRTAQGGATTTSAPIIPQEPAPALSLRIARAGNTLTAYYSTDGSAWTMAPNASATLPLSSTALLGLAATSHNANANVLASARFDTLSINGTAELAALDTATVHDTQPSGQVGAFTTEARLYNSPAGTPDDDGWHTRDTTLLASSGSGGTSGGYHTAATSYDLQTAPDTSSGIEASLTNEDAVTLGVGLASANGVAPSSTGGQSSANSTTYASGSSSGSGIGANAVRPLFASNPVALSMRATASGLDVRLTLSSASAQGPFVLSLAPDPRLQIGQDATGVISMTQPVTNYGDDGTPDVIRQTEYAAEAPLLTDSSGDPTAPVSTGPATATLGTTSDASGAVTPTISLSVDPAWLQAAGRVFPVTLDLPLDTGSALADTGTVATVSSCRPTAAAVTTALVVGAANGSAYNGQLSFDLSALPADAPILSATLRLYTPAPTTTTGALVYPNAPDPGANSGDGNAPPLSWATAPTVMTGSVGLAQSGSDGHWQSWDVTALAQRWAQNPGSNNGLTLAGGGAPVRLASPLGAGVDAPATAPYLDIVYGQASGSKPRPTRCAGFTGAGSYGDCSTFIYGLAGGFAQCDGASPVDPNCPSSNNMNLQFAANGRTGSPPPNRPQGVGAQFIRFNESLASRGQTATWAQAYSAMQAAYDKGLDPIVNFGQSLSSPFADQQSWYYQLKAFAQGLPRFRNPRPTYFEIGNEPNCCGLSISYPLYNFDSPNGHVDYRHIFAYAAVALSQYLRPGFPYRILTAGMLSPRAPLNGKDALHHNNLCSRGPTPASDRSHDGYLLTIDALNTALNEGVNFVGTGNRTLKPKRAVLGLAVHPYSYQTPPLKRGGYFRNFHALAGTSNRDHPEEQRPYGLCNDIELMNDTWTRRTPLFQHMPLVYTETNWQSGRVPPAGPPNNQTRARPAMTGSYLVDLMTYLYDRRCAWTNGICRSGIVPGATPLRVMWFTGTDSGIYSANDPNGSPLDSGLYYNTATKNQANSASYEKPLTVSYPFAQQSLPITPYCHNGKTQVTSAQTEPFAYFWLRNAACY